MEANQSLILEDNQINMPDINIKPIAKNYFSDLKLAINKIHLEDIQKISDTLFNSYINGNTIFIMGNGGSATTASHMACDLGKGTLTNVYNQEEKRLKVISITDNVATMTAFANDVSFKDIFSQQLRNLIGPKDVLIGISASGNSPNIIKALKYAKSQKAITIGLFGNSGGKAKNFTDLNIIIQSNNFGIIEDLHLTLSHLLTTCLTFMKKQIDNQKSRKPL
ncbi:MAG: SIS domain-containing protein [Actinobacteria bacterium]|nr:SIS domain-containing protein [Actinomycetota bacterium]